MKLLVPILLILAHLLHFTDTYGQVSIETQSQSLEKVNYQTKKLIPFPSRYRIAFSDSLSVVNRASKYGIIDSTGREIVPLIYDEISIEFPIRKSIFDQLWYSNEYFYNYWGDGNESEEEYARLLEIEVKNARSYLHVAKEFRTNPMFAVRKGDAWGVINKFNEQLIPIQYDYIQEIGQDLFLAKKNGKSGIINSKNDVLVPLAIDAVITLPLLANGVTVSELNDRGIYALLKKDIKYGAINLFTQKIIPPKYDSLDQCFFLPEDDCRCGFSFGSRHLEYNRTHSYDNVLKYQIGNKVGLLNVAEMQEITPPIYDSIQFEHGGFLHYDNIVCLDGKYTFLTHENTQLHPAFYEEISSLFADPITQKRYKEPYTHFYKVKLDGHYEILNEKGEKLWNSHWDDIIFCSQMTDKSTFEFIVERNGKFGVINEHEEIIVPIKYDQISRKYEDGYYYLLQRRKKSKRVSFL